MDDLTTYKQKWFEFLDYKPHAGQQKIHELSSEKRFVVASCGRRWGKSMSAAREAETLVTQADKHVWIVAPTYSTSERIFRMVYDDLIIKHNLPTRRKSLNEQYIEFEWGSTIEGKSAEHPESCIGAGNDLVIIDEASKMNLKKIFEMYLRPTLSDRKGRCIMISTPEGYDGFYEYFIHAQRAEMWAAFNSPSWENHYAFPQGEQDEDLIEAKSSMTKEVFDQEFAAEFTALSGRVYSDFSRRTHVGNHPYNSMLPVYCSLDFGYRMPAAVFFQTAKLGNKSEEHIFVIDEILHEENLTITDLCKAVQAKNYRIARVYGDPAGYQMQSSVGMGEADIFRQITGMPVISRRDRYSRNVQSGISHVRNYMMSADGTVRFHIDHKCKEIVEDIESYRYPEHKEGSNLKNEPLKDGYHDHGCDALRYGICGRFPIRKQLYKVSSR